MDFDSERLNIDEVRDLLVVGEPLPFAVYDLQNRMLLNQRQVIGSERQWVLLMERSAWVARDLVEALRAERQQQAAQHFESNQRAPNLFDRWERALWDLDALLRATIKGKASAADWHAEVDTFIKLVDREPDVALYLAVRQEDRRFALYALAHSLHAAVLCLLGARQAGWSMAQQHATVGAALSMNVGMLELQAQMAEQDTPPTQKQLAHIRAHPEQGAALLRAVGLTDAVWLQAVAEHHERNDGSGYPKGLVTVIDEARLLRYADVYMAKITPRASRPPLSPQTAAGQLFKQEPGSKLAMALIKAIGVHPPGALVNLKSGEVAVVTRRHPTGPAPQVCTLSDSHGQPSVHSTPLNSAEPQHAITGPCTLTELYPRVLPERAYGILPP
jgi:HD-GYP domain-containing protein (c-di-GMP phosphodiesterase class II)